MAKSINPSDLGFFSVLISSGSLGAAARELGVTTAAVSKHLAQMESRLGLVLVNRTTRRMSLTHEGEIYLEHARRILGEIDDLEHMLWGSTKAPQGLLRVNATLGFGRSHIAPLIAEYVKNAPSNLVGRPFNNGNNGVDNKELIEVNSIIRNHPVEEVGAWLRESMTAMKKIV